MASPASVELGSAPSTTSSWSPLHLPVFRALWIATIVSNIGTWMHDVGAAWLMISLSGNDPLMVALVQAATTLPMFLFALPAGVFADIVDRRRMLLVAQIWMLIAASLLGVLTILDLVNPALLLGFTFALGLGAALNAPPFQAIVPELVPRQELPAAVALNSLGINVSRAIGPALGGLIVAALGPAAVFVLNAVSVLGVLAVLYRWRREPRASTLPPEHFTGAVRAGFRYVRGSAELRAVLARAVAFFIFASATWALLPVVAYTQLGSGPAGYGVLLAFLGAGAVAGALLLPRLRAAVSADRLTVGATTVFAGVALALALVPNLLLACIIMAIAGAAWIAILSSFNVAAQTVLPGWVKARALAVFLLVFQGSMAAGSVIWGQAASRFGLTAALAAAASGQLLGLAAAYRWRIAPDLAVDRAPSMHWPAPVVAREPEPDRGPVMVTVEYRIDPAQTGPFVAVMHELRGIRRRDGALSWGLYEDAAVPGRMVEAFVAESWVEHLRQHERVTAADREVQDRARAFHIGGGAPIVSHLIAPFPGD